MTFLNSAIIGIIVEIYRIVGDLGLALILFTILVRTLLVPLTLKSMKAQKQISLIQPEIKKLKATHGSDKAAFQQAQLELYKKYNVNPIAGCIPQLIQIGLLIVLYQVLVDFLGRSEINGLIINPNFLWLDLSQPDPRWILPILAGVTQFIFSLMLAPATEIPDVVPNDSKKKAVKEANKKEEDMADMAAAMQQQMIFMLPVMTAVFAWKLPSGLALYWIATTLYSIAQQWFISGPGGLTSYARRAWYMLSRKGAA